MYGGYRMFVSYECNFSTIQYLFERNIEVFQHIKNFVNIAKSQLSKNYFPPELYLTIQWRNCCSLTIDWAMKRTKRSQFQGWPSNWSIHKCKKVYFCSGRSQPACRRRRRQRKEDCDENPWRKSNSKTKCIFDNRVFEWPAEEIFTTSKVTTEDYSYTHSHTFRSNQYIWYRSWTR